MSSRAPGRPRNPEIDEAVLAATRELLVEVGYSRLSYELIAQRAGVNRPAIYRRWPSKAHVVHAAVFPPRQVENFEAELFTGDKPFDEDFTTMIAQTLASYSRPEARAAIPGLLTDRAEPDSISDGLDDLTDRVRAHLARRIERAVAEGELRPGVDADLLINVMVGTVVHRVVEQGQPDPSLASDLAELLLAGIRNPQATAKRSAPPPRRRRSAATAT